LLKIPIAIAKGTGLIDLDELLAATAALQVQVSRDFSPAWNIDAELAVVMPGEKPPTGTWWIVVLDNSDLGAALGYHDLTPQGLPLAKVFVETAKKLEQEWTVLFSHELLEMLVDPFIYLTALAPSPYGTSLCAYEVCDACQPEGFGYRIDGQLMSDFCLPAWFDANKYGSAGPFDFRGHIKQPFELLPGGFAMCRPLFFSGSWELVTAPGSPLSYTMRPRVGSRRERRRIGFVNWHKCTVETGDDFRTAKLLRPGAGDASGRESP